MLTRSIRGATLLALAAVVLAAPQAQAAPQAAVTAPMALNFSADFLWNPDPDNDTQVYLHVSNMAYNPPREQVEQIFPKIHNPESEYPVMLFMASECRCGLTRVFTLRSKGLTWIQVMGKLGIPRERVFVESTRDPGPPYGKAYGHWKNHQGDDVLISNDDVYYWVNVRTMARYFGTSPVTVQDWRDSGQTWKAIAKGEYKNFSKKNGRKVNQAGMGSPQSGDKPGRGKGKDKGHKD